MKAQENVKVQENMVQKNKNSCYTCEWYVPGEDICSYSMNPLWGRDNGEGCQKYKS